MSLREKELVLHKQKDDNSFEYAKKALVVQKEDRSEDRIHKQKLRRDTYILICVLALMIAVIIWYSIAIGKTEIAMEIIKAIVFLGSGGAGGYAVGKIKRPSSGISIDQENSDD